MKRAKGKCGEYHCQSRPGEPRTADVGLSFGALKNQTKDGWGDPRALHKVIGAICRSKHSAGVEKKEEG